jgi:hypothetical protein
MSLSAVASVEWLVGIAAALTALGVIGKYGLKAFRAVDAGIKGIEYVKTQMERNGGSTQADAIARIEATTTQTAERLSAIEQRVAVVEANTEIHATRLDSGAERINSVIESLDSLAAYVAEIRKQPPTPEAQP